MLCSFSSFFFSFIFVVSSTKKVSHFIIHYWHFPPDNSPPKNCVHVCLNFHKMSSSIFYNFLLFFVLSILFEFRSIVIYCRVSVAMLLRLHCRYTSNGKRMDWYHFARFFRALKTIYMCVLFFLSCRLIQFRMLFAKCWKLDFVFGVDGGILCLPVHYR